MAIKHLDALVELIAIRDEYVVAALSKPKGKTAFHYGEACGFYKGIMHCINVLEQRIEEDAAEAGAKESLI